MKKIILDEKTSVDSRGWSMAPLEIVELTGKDIGNMHVVSLKPGAVRGNHVHPDSTEWVVFCGGPAAVAYKTHSNEGFSEIVIKGDRPELYEIPPGTSHAIKNTSDREIFLTVFSNTDNPKTDRCELLS